MQMNMAMGSFMDMRVGSSCLNGSLSARQNRDAAKVNAGNVFGPQCKVTISHEGRRLSEQHGEEKPKSLTAAATERLLLRQQKQDEANMSEQSDTISEISNLMRSIKKSYAAGEDKETIANKQEALNRLLELKARQEEENERRVKDAAGSAAGASRNQEEIDRKNADLYLMLKSLEEQEEDEEGEECAGGSDAEPDSEEADGGRGIGGQFQESASMLGVSAARRELQVKGMIDNMFESGYGRLAEADGMMHEIQAEIDLAMEALGEGNLSEDERDQLMSEHIERANNMMVSNYGEITDLRRKGHQEIRDAKEVELRHIAINPLDGVDRAKQAIMEAGVTAAFHEVSQGTLDKASEELEERVRDAIDRRDDIVKDPEDIEQEKTEEMEEEENDEALEAEKNPNLTN